MHIFSPWVKIIFEDQKHHSMHCSEAAQDLGEEQIWKKINTCNLKYGVTSQFKTCNKWCQQNIFIIHISLKFASDLVKNCVLGSNWFEGTFNIFDLKTYISYQFFWLDTVYVFVLISYKDMIYFFFVIINLRSRRPYSDNLRLCWDVV